MGGRAANLLRGAGTGRVCRVGGNRVGAWDRLVGAEFGEVNVEIERLASPEAQRLVSLPRVQCVWAPHFKLPDEVMQWAYELHVVLVHRQAAAEGARRSRVPVWRACTQVFHDTRSAESMAIVLAADRWLPHDLEANLPRTRRQLPRVSFELLAPANGGIIVEDPAWTDRTGSMMDWGASESSGMWSEEHAPSHNRGGGAGVRTVHTTRGGGAGWRGDSPRI